MSTTTSTVRGHTVNVRSKTARMRPCSRVVADARLGPYSLMDQGYILPLPYLSFRLQRVPPANDTDQEKHAVCPVVPPKHASWTSALVCFCSARLVLLAVRYAMPLPRTPIPDCPPRELVHSRCDHREFFNHHSKFDLSLHSR